MPARRTDAAAIGMMLRSFLFVPADNERKIARGLQSEADALILDLEVPVAPDRKAEARKLLAGQLADLDGSTVPKLYVRINPLDSPHVLEDLLAATHAAVAGIVLPKACGRRDIDRCRHTWIWRRARRASLPVPSAFSPSLPRRLRRCSDCRNSPRRSGGFMP